MKDLLAASDLEENLDANALTVYNICFEFQRDARNEMEKMYARILGYLVLHAPSPIARTEVEKAIHSFSRNKDRHGTLTKLAEAFMNYFIRVFKKPIEHTPKSSSHSSRPSFNQAKQLLMESTREAPENHYEAKKQALIRDGFRCMLSGVYDDTALDAADEIPSLNKEEISQEGSVFTECVHIAPEPTYLKLSSPPEEKEYFASVLAVLEHFGYNVEKLNGPKAHSLYNIMTMEHNIRDRFNRLHLWLEATNTENCYRIETTKPILFFLRVPKIVKFTSSDPNLLPLPSPELLALHAACAKVAHFSGAGDYIDKLDRDLDGLDVLEYEGGSFDVLDHALRRRQIGSRSYVSDVTAL